MDIGGTNKFLPRLTGHSTQDALRILHDELYSVLSAHEITQRRRSLKEKLRASFLNHNNRHSVLHWSNVAVILALVLLLIIAYGAQKQRDAWLLVEALFLLACLVLNVYFVGLDEKLKDNELADRAKSILKVVKVCSEGPEWRPEHFVNLHAPLAPSVSLQWTYRDDSVVNLPSCFLVEGDVILLRPGQTVPAKCRTLEYYSQAIEDGEIQELDSGDIFNPTQRNRQSQTFSLPEAREPSRPMPFIMLETPFSENLKTMLNQSAGRPVSVLNNERYMVYSVWVERRILPVIFITLLLTNILRYVFLDGVGHWTEMFIVLQVQAVLPLTAIVLPLIWRALDIYGVSKIIIVFQKCKNNLQSEGMTLDEFGSEMSIQVTPGTSYSWRDLLRTMCQVTLGNAPTLPRTSNLAHVLGNVTSFCCIDKKGILSWPNPTAEKVFFLRNDRGSRDKQWSSDSGTTEDADSGSVHMDSFDEEFKSISAKNILKPDHDFPFETNFEVLDLTHDAKDGYKLQFDDPGWKKYLSSLKPLGLNILLNTCNLATVNKYTEFADHVTNASQKREETAPVLNRRCFCELARQIGFSDNALEIFRLHQVLGMYRHLPTQALSRGTLVPGSKSVKYKMPMPNMFSVVLKEINTGMSQLMSQGTADMLLDACSDYWDGADLCNLTEVDRKKITDFYQRTSMSSYCTAFSYRPLTASLGAEFRDLYLEIPDIHDHLYPQVHSPTPTKSWDTESLDSRIQSAKNRYHCSMDSLLMNMDSSSIHDIDGAFRIQCNQVFIGMISMQYQAKQDIVQLIEDLESACIRFVHYSKENELRSRVFSEKMGLEAGWNCHISLLSEKLTEQDEAAATATTNNQAPNNAKTALTVPNAPGGAQPPIGVTIPQTAGKQDITCCLQRPRQKRSNESLRYRRGSAPGAINLEITQVTFESGTPTATTISPLRSPPQTITSGSETVTPGSEMIVENHVPSEETAIALPPVLSPAECSQSDQHRTSRRHSDTHSDNLTEPLLEVASPDGHPLGGMSTTDDLNGSLDEVELELLDKRLSREEETDENLSTSESYPASSHFTENTDSVTGGFGLTNRAKLPKGIENIRPHLDNVDNVPLLVSLFTDCTPQTTREMTKILQEYGEVVVCLGSSANISNTGVFLQADCSLSVEPLYPHVCMCDTTVGGAWVEPTPGPLELSNLLNSLPCALFFNRSDKISIMQLIGQARQHIQGMRHTFLLLLLVQLSLVILQLLDAMLLPPALAPRHVVWLAIFALPILVVTINANPPDPDIMKKALGKNMNHLSKQVVLEFLLYFMLACVPTVVVCLICHAINLNVFCWKVATPLNATCHLFYGSADLGDEGEWNGWATDLYSGLVLSQNIVAFQFLLYAGFASMCFIHRYHHLWQRLPFTNHVWCIVVFVLLVLQLLYFAADVGIHNRLGKHVFRMADIPVPTFIITFLWPIVQVCIQELIKRRERKLSVRYQKRARLDFGTKLGMNSPF